MSIRPVEFNGMIQRTQDVSTLKQQEDNRPFVEQHNIAVQQQKQQERQLRQVAQTKKKQGSGKEKYDAKEKGKNKYEDMRKKKDKGEGNDPNDRKTYMNGVAIPTFDMKA